MNIINRNKSKLKLKDLKNGEVFRFNDPNFSKDDYALKTSSGFLWLTEYGFKNFIIKLAKGSCREIIG